MLKDEILWSRNSDTKDIKDGRHTGGSHGTFGNTRGLTVTSGPHHVAIVVKDIKRSIEFYEGCLGMKCRAIYPMHGVKGAKHAFMDAGNNFEISFVEFAQVNYGTPGISYPARNDAPSPITTLHHFAYRCESLQQLYEIREQVKNYGVKASKVIDHHFIHSFYFSDPDGFHLEVTCTTRGYSANEYKPEIATRKLLDSENDWDEPAAIKRAEEQQKKQLSKL